MELRGNLIDFSLPDIIQLVGFGRKTGALRLECAEGQAVLFFDRGNVVHAECPGSVGEEAVYLLFRVPAGDFRFQAEVLPAQRTIAMDPTNLIMEAARLLDEAHRDDAAELVLNDSFETRDWFGEEFEQRGAGDIKADIKTLLQDRYGSGARKLLQAVDRCGDTAADLNDMADRAEKYIQVFLDSGGAREVARQVRQLISGSGS